MYAVKLEGDEEEIFQVHIPVLIYNKEEDPSIKKED